MQSWILNNILKGLIEFLGGLIDLVGSSIGSIYNFMININNSSTLISGAVTFTTAFSIALISLTAVVKYLDTYVFEVNNDPDADPMNYAIRIAQTTAVISCNGWIFNTLLEFSNNFYSDLIGSASSMEMPSNISTLLASCSSNLNATTAAFVVIIMVVILAFIVNTVVAAKRGAELALMKISAPIFFVDLMTTNRERYNSFIIGYLFAFISFSIQMFCFLMALKCCAAMVINDMGYVWASLAWLWLSISGSKFLEKYIYKSGVGGATSGGARMAAQALLLRK